MLVVAYCPGGSLHTHVNISLKEDGRGFDEHRAAFYVAEIAQAIAHLHSHGIVHRDLKLENVLVCVEINQCVGCTRYFFTKLALGRAYRIERW